MRRRRRCTDRPVVKSKLNDALSPGKKVLATSSPSKLSSSTAKPTTRKNLVKLIPVANPSETPTKNKAQVKELGPKSGRLTSRACACQSRRGQVGGRGRGRGGDIYQSPSRAHIQEHVHVNNTRKSRRSRKRRWRLPLPLSPSQRRVRRTSLNQDPRRIICCWWGSVHAVPVHFLLVVMEKGASAGISVLLVMGGGGLGGAGTVRRALRWCRCMK